MPRCRIKGTKTSKKHCLMNMKRAIILHKNTSAVRSVSHIPSPSCIMGLFLLSSQSQFKEIINGECAALFPGFCQNGFDFEGGAGPLGSQIHLHYIQPQNISVIRTPKWMQQFMEMGGGLVLRGMRRERNERGSLWLIASAWESGVNAAASLELNSVFKLKRRPKK